MIEFHDAPPQVLSLAAVGHVTRHDVQRAEEEIERRLEEPGPIGLLLDLSRLDDVAVGALAEEAKLEMHLLGRWRHFPRVAVISDREWIRRAARLVGPMAPGVEMRGFSPEDADAALAFAAEAGVPPAEPAEAVRLLETGDPAVHAWEIDGRLTPADVERVSAPLREAFDRGGTVNLLVRIKESDGFDASVLTERSLIALKLAALRHVDRYAVVGAKGWVERMAGLIDPLVAPHVRVFDAEDEDAAWAWVLKRPGAEDWRSCRRPSFVDHDHRRAGRHALFEVGPAGGRILKGRVRSKPLEVLGAVGAGMLNRQEQRLGCPGEVRPAELAADRAAEEQLGMPRSSPSVSSAVEPVRFARAAPATALVGRDPQRPGVEGAVVGRTEPAVLRRLGVPHRAHLGDAPGRRISRGSTRCRTWRSGCRLLP
jgi:hypothetical protein